MTALNTSFKSTILITSNSPNPTSTGQASIPKTSTSALSSSAISKTTSSNIQNSVMTSSPSPTPRSTFSASQSPSWTPSKTIGSATASSSPSFSSTPEPEIQSWEPEISSTKPLFDGWNVLGTNSFGLFNGALTRDPVGMNETVMQVKYPAGSRNPGNTVNIGGIGVCFFP
jgi:hypothetical protein